MKPSRSGVPASCSACGKPLRVAAASAGKGVKCKGCVAPARPRSNVATAGAGVALFAALTMLVCGWEGGEMGEYMAGMPPEVERALADARAKGEDPPQILRCRQCRTVQIVAGPSISAGERCPTPSCAGKVAVSRGPKGWVLTCSACSMEKLERGYADGDPCPASKACGTLVEIPIELIEGVKRTGGRQAAAGWSGVAAGAVGLIGAFLCFPRKKIGWFLAVGAMLPAVAADLLALAAGFETLVVYGVPPLVYTLAVACAIAPRMREFG